MDSSVHSFFRYTCLSLIQSTQRVTFDWPSCEPHFKVHTRNTTGDIVNGCIYRCDVVTLTLISLYVRHSRPKQLDVSNTKPSRKDLYDTFMLALTTATCRVCHKTTNFDIILQRNPLYEIQSRL